MSADFADAVAQKFHEAYEDIAPSEGYETRRESAVPWSDVPDANKQLMRKTVGRLLDEGSITVGPNLAPKESA